MQESLFNKRPQNQNAPAAQPVHSVSRLVDYLRRLFLANKHLSDIRVRGEVSGFRDTNGLWRFTLKEGKETLTCLVWASDSARLTPPRDGDEVICGGAVTVYGPHSQYQLIAKTIELTGAGAIYAELKRLQEQFRAEGLFAPERKRPLPQFPRRLAIVSSRESRGMNDVLATLAKRAPFVEVTFIETRVQGDGAEIDIAAAIDRASKIDVDVILVTRGGGSVEDLFPFNKEPVVRAIVRARHPVITAVGHNLDIHVSDEVADKFFETPSNAANYFGEIGDEFRGRIERARIRIERAVQQRLYANVASLEGLRRDLRHAVERFVPEKRYRLGELERRLEQQTPQLQLNERLSRITGARSRLESAARYVSERPAQRLARARERLSAVIPQVSHQQSERLNRLSTRLNDLNPEQLLRRGYAIVSYDGKPLRDASKVKSGDTIEARLAHGRLLARVEESRSDG